MSLLWERFGNAFTDGVVFFSVETVESEEVKPTEEPKKEPAMVA